MSFSLEIIILVVPKDIKLGLWANVCISVLPLIYQKSVVFANLFLGEVDNCNFEKFRHLKPVWLFFYEFMILMEVFAVFKFSVRAQIKSIPSTTPDVVI